MTTTASANMSNKSANMSNKNDDNFTLPAWIYNNQRFFTEERLAIFSESWQIACHVSEIAKPGDYITLKFINERAAVIRLDDGSIAAFHNTCRHRAHAVLSGEAGHCKRVHVCPYHAWTYNMDGSLRGIPGGSADDIQQAGPGLPKIDTEVFAGFVWIRFGGQGPSVAQRLEKFTDLLHAYRIDEMQPNHDLVEEEHAVDWKNIMDNYLEGYHVAAGHPNLNQMFTAAYDVTSDAELGYSFATQVLRDTPNGDEAAQDYMNHLPHVAHLPADYARRWSYLSLFPNTNIGLQPDSIDYFIAYPIAPGRAVFRSQSFSLPNPPAAVQQSRIAAGRVWEAVQNEDNGLTISVQEGLAGSSYQHGYLSPNEPGVRAFRDWMRQRMTVAREVTAPLAYK